MDKLVNDYFGITREEKILQSGVRDVFTPNTPIDNIRFFCGRNTEVQRIIECLNSRGQHILLFGDRGVGKTSLAITSCHLFQSETKSEGELIIKRCSSDDTFQSIVEAIFTKYEIEYKTVVEKTGFWASIKTLFGGSRETTVTITPNINSPSWVASKIQDKSGIIIIDEFDVVHKPEDKNKIAELMKQLSDAGSYLTIFAVGIADSSKSLIGSHPSLQRCLKEIGLGRMSKEELKGIIDVGQDRLGISFSNEVSKIIVNISSGFPHYTQLLALKSAEESIANDLSTVTRVELDNALLKASNDVEGTLKNTYDEAIRSQTRQKQQVNVNILLAASICEGEEFTTQDLRDKYREITGVDIQLNPYLKSIVSDTAFTVLRRLATGIYKFNDPRMPSYIKLRNKYVK